MRSSEIACVCALVGSMLLSGCYYDDYYGQQGGGYGDPNGQQGGYGNQQQGGYPNQQGGNPNQQGSYGQNPQQGYPSNDPYAQQGGGQGYSESGDVVTVPGNGAGNGSSPDYSYDNSGYDSGGSASYGSTGGSGSAYTVKKGDNLYRIGKAHGASMQEIMQANGLTDSTIYPGQELRIP